MAGVAIGTSTTRDDTPAQQIIAAAGQSIHKALDCQAFIVSLFTTGRERDAQLRTPIESHMQCGAMHGPPIVSPCACQDLCFFFFFHRGVAVSGAQMWRRCASICACSTRPCQPMSTP